MQEAPELPEVGDAHVFKHDVESNLRGATMETACAVSLASALLVSVETKLAPLIGLREFAMLLSCHHTSNAWVRAAVGLFSTSPLAFRLWFNPPVMTPRGPFYMN